MGLFARKPSKRVMRPVALFENLLDYLSSLFYKPSSMSEFMFSKFSRSFACKWVPISIP
jgi:hypothetical protein